MSPGYVTSGGWCMGGTQLVSSHALVGIPILTMIIIKQTPVQSCCNKARRKLLLASSQLCSLCAKVT